MPFVSRTQERAAFAGKLGAEMKAKAPEFAAKTNETNLPEKIGKKKEHRVTHGASLADLARG